MEEVALSFYIYELTLYGTCLCSFKSQMLPTKTLGISTASPRALSKDSLICLILSNDCLEIIENTKMYPSTPTDAFLDRREYSSYSIKQSINICKRVIIGISNEKWKQEPFLTIPAVSTMSVAKLTFLNLTILWWVFSMVGS